MIDDELQYGEAQSTLTSFILEIFTKQILFLSGRIILATTVYLCKSIDIPYSYLYCVNKTVRDYHHGLLRSVRVYQGLLGTLKIYKELSGSTMVQQDSQQFTSSYQDLLDSTEFHQSFLPIH